MFADWKNDVAHVKKSFGALGKKYPKMLQAYGALGAAAAEGNVLDAKTRELIALAVAVTTRCESCIGVHADEAVKAGATEEEVAAALARKELYDSFSPHLRAFLSLKLTAL
ncbi:MAG: carboxymuconolactone decarboxylase family protein [Haemophilus parainfluenzae]|nr:carboxymuconolactone decarboxylase family protein [Haemophilus parainfluenzae]